MFQISKKTCCRGGFTLIEIMIAVVLLGMAIAAIVGSAGTFSVSSFTGADITTAEFLVSQINTITTILPITDPETTTTTFGPEEASLAAYDDIDDFDNASFNPPIDSQRQSLTDFSRFTQQIIVQNINPGNLSQAIGDHGSDFVRITVTILADGSEITSTSWLRTVD